MQLKCTGNKIMIKITYLEHSGFAVECDDYVLIFDYYKGNLPQFDKDKKNLCICKSCALRSF